MDFKKIAGDLGTTITRAVQYTEEKLGQAEKTEYDANLEQQLKSAEATQHCAEEIVRCTEAALQPNPAHRIEDAICERLERRLRDRKSPLQELGQALASAGDELGPGSDYGAALSKVGQAQMSLAQLQYEYSLTAAEVLVQPMRNYLANEARSLRNERKILEQRRLDLDAARAKLAKAQPQARHDAEQQCKQLGEQFEQQMMATRVALESVHTAQEAHSRCLRDFADAQAEYHSECLRRVQELQKQLQH